MRRFLFLAAPAVILAALLRSPAAPDPTAARPP